MGKRRLIPTAFLLTASLAFVALPPALPRGTVMSSLLDDLAPGEPKPPTGMWHFLQSLVTRAQSNQRCAGTSLKTLAAADIDWRGCDGDWNRVADFWTADVAGLYDLRPPEPAKADARANDRDWCHVNDFWTVDVVGLYTIVIGETVLDTNDAAIKLIELSVASADEP